MKRSSLAVIAVSCMSVIAIPSLEEKSLIAFLANPKGPLEIDAWRARAILFSVSLYDKKYHDPSLLIDCANLICEWNMISEIHAIASQIAVYIRDYEMKDTKQQSRWMARVRDRVRLYDKINRSIPKVRQLIWDKYNSIKSDAIASSSIVQVE